MICTCTLNPSLDYYMEFDDSIHLGELNRSNMEYFDAGGKGMNVSIVLNNLRIPTRAFGFLGGFSREYYIRLMQKYTYIRPNFTYVEGNTRINLKLMDGTSITELNAQGPHITNANMENLYKKTDRLDHGDYFVLAGSCQPYLKDDVLEMVLNCINNDVRVVLDVKEDLLQDVLEKKPFLVKTTFEECDPNLSFEEAIEVSKKLHKDGARHVLALYKKETAILVSEEGVYVSKIRSSKDVIMGVGMSDALLAGFLMNYLRSNDLKESFKFGACCCMATANSKGLATKEKMNTYLDDVVISKQ